MTINLDDRQFKNESIGEHWKFLNFFILVREKKVEEIGDYSARVWTKFMIKLRAKKKDKILKGSVNQHPALITDREKEEKKTRSK